jgi:pyruvate dehydrogenase (quinone)
LKNPDFGEVAKAMGLWGGRISKVGELEDSIQAWFAQPGPALLHVNVKPMQMVTPPSPFVSPEAVYARLQGDPAKVLFKSIV